MDGEEQVAESFSVFRPIVMANIWGMEEVLGDRCISMQLEKSENPIITRLVENFNENILVKEIINYFRVNQCSLCSVVTSQNIYTTWNEYIYTNYTNNINDTNNTNNIGEFNDLFKKICDTNIDGRNLELFFPLFLIAKQVGDDILEQTLNYAKEMIHNKRVDEIVESKDIMVFKMISEQESNKYYVINDLTIMFRQRIEADDKMDWLNSKWMGRALKRLQLTVDKRRVAEGIEVTLDVQKAIRKMEFFLNEGQK
jgi:hypothetical protein